MIRHKSDMKTHFHFTLPMQKHVFVTLHHLPISVPQALQLNSSENDKLVIMASTIGIPSAPVLRVVSDNFTLVSRRVGFFFSKGDLSVSAI